MIKVEFRFVHAVLIIVASVFSFVAQGQSIIEGKVVDQSQGIPGVTMLLLTMDSIMFDGTVTDSVGYYIFENVPTGTYFLSASTVGYATDGSEVVVGEQRSLTLPNIILREIATTLDEFEVRADKQLFDQMPGKLVINLASSITSAGNTVLEVLQKSPGIVVNKTNGVITMRGKTGVRIMVNEKLLEVSMDVALQMLDGISASNVERIELITAPGAKYDADGTAGIIHIITKQNVELGTNISVGVSFGYRWAEQIGGNLSVNHRAKRLASWIDYSITRNHNLHYLDIARQSIDFDKIARVHGRRENVTTQHNLSAGFEWKLNATTFLTFGVTGYSRNWSMHAVNEDSNVMKDSTIATRMDIRQSNIWRSGTTGVGIHSKLNLKSDLHFNVDYLYYHNNNPSFYQNETFYKDDIHKESEIDLKKKTPIHFVVGKADYQYAASQDFYLEAGVKFVTSKFDNNVMVQRHIDDEWTVDPNFTSNSVITEKLGALYISSRWKPGVEWEINTGLRYEYTHFVSFSEAEANSRTERNYGYLFPSLLVKKQLGNEKNVSFSYSRRISRPTYNDIASYATFWSTTTFTAANTFLWPAVSDAISINFQCAQWTLSAQYTHSKNEIAPLQPTINTNSNILIYRSENLDHLNTLSFSTSYGFNLYPWWEVQSNVTAQHQLVSTSYLDYNSTFSRYGVNVHVVNLLKLPKDFTFEVSGLYQSKTFSGITQYLRFGSLNIAIQKSFGTKGSVRLAIDDLLYTNNWRIKTYSPANNLDVYFTYDWHNQFIRLSYSWSLGNAKMKSVKTKSSSEDERQRIGN
jgi:hypothetical protein